MSTQNWNLADFFESLEAWGLTDVMLPFLLVFTLVFAVLEKTKVLGMEKKNLNVVVSLVMALSTIIPHITSSYPLDYDCGQFASLQVSWCGLKGLPK